MGWVSVVYGNVYVGVVVVRGFLGNDERLCDNFNTHNLGRCIPCWYSRTAELHYDGLCNRRCPPCTVVMSGDSITTVPGK